MGLPPFAKKRFDSKRLLAKGFFALARAIWPRGGSGTPPGG